MKTIGIVILIVGLLITVVSGINYFTADDMKGASDLELTYDVTNDVNWTPLVGIAVMAFGGALYFFAGKKA